jgi:hypothetical protein
MKSIYDSERKNGGRAPRPESPGTAHVERTHREPQTSSVGADKVSTKTWLGRFWDGASWQYVKAARQPKVNAKFLSRREALEAAKSKQFRFSSKEERPALPGKQTQAAFSEL